MSVAAGNHSTMTIKTLIYTILALIAFAANSVLCRLALADGAIDAAGFTSVRLLAGVVVLFAIMSIMATKAAMKGKKSTANVSRSKGSWLAGLMLFIYAVCFSFAYLSLDTATGAVILFGSVQLSIILLSLFMGNRLQFTEWSGVLLAFGGFVYLMSPGVSMPSVSGFVLMATAGLAWGIYTLKGKGSQNPLMDTSYNFLRTLPLVMVLVIMNWPGISLSGEGILWAVLSGGIASGVGYTLWYMALAGLQTTQAAVVQLFVPVIAASGGVIFIAEPITLRLILAAILILGGILLVISPKQWPLKQSLK
jgi:drug/metabolite transporter (DMT)-like permease